MGMHLYGLMANILLVIAVGVFAVCVYAFVNAAMQRPDAYTATGKQTKPIWLAILGLAILLAVSGWLSVMGTAIAAAAAGVYLADVRPRLLEVQGKSR